MKLITRITKVVMMFVISLIIVQCDTNKQSSQEGEQNTTIEEGVNDKMKAEKKALSRSLEKMRKDIHSKIDDINNQLASAEKEAEDQLKKTKNELIEQQRKVNKTMKKVKNATEEEWGELKMKANKTMDNASEEIKILTKNNSNKDKKE